MPAPAARRKPAKPKMTPLSATISSKRNSVRVTRRADGSYRFKFGGAVAAPAAAGAVLVLVPVFAPETALAVGFFLGAALAALLTWLGWTWFVRRESVDSNPDANHFEGTRRKTGATSVAAKGTAASVVTVGLVLGAFFLLHPLERWALYVGFGVAAAAGGGLLYWRLKPKAAPAA